MKKNNTDYKKKLNILNITKEIISSKGWSENLIKLLVKQGVNSSDLLVSFNNDYKKILLFSLEELNYSLENKIKKINIINIPTHKRIKKILNLKIEIMNEDKLFYKKTFYHLLLPQNSKIMKKNLYKSVNSMWYFAGDNSTDFNFYTKRLILTAVYVNALFVFFNKDNFSAEQNIDENLKRLSRIPKLKDRLLFFRENLPIFIKGLFN